MFSALLTLAGSALFRNNGQILLDRNGVEGTLLQPYGYGMVLAFLSWTLYLFAVIFSIYEVTRPPCIEPFCPSPTPEPDSIPDHSSNISHHPDPRPTDAAHHQNPTQPDNRPKASKTDKPKKKRSNYSKKSAHNV